MSKATRYHLGIIVDFFVNDEISQVPYASNTSFSTYFISDLLEQIYNKSSNIKLKMDIIYNIYNKLIDCNESYKTLPIISRGISLRKRLGLWDFKDLGYQYRIHLHAPFLYKNKKNIRASLDYLSNTQRIHYPSTTAEFISNRKYDEHDSIFKTSKDINWNKMITSHSGTEQCPYCCNKFNILTIELDSVSINTLNKTFIFDGYIMCKYCHFLDHPTNKRILNNLFVELDETIIELWQLLCKNNIKYCTHDIANIIKNTSKKIKVPKYILIIMLSNISNKLDLLITLKLFRKKCSSKLNNLYKLIIDYV